MTTVDSKYSEYLKSVVDSTLLSEDTFQNILKNCFAVLVGQEVHSICKDYGFIQHF